MRLTERTRQGGGINNGRDFRKATEKHTHMDSSNRVIPHGVITVFLGAIEYLFNKI